MFLPLTCYGCKTSLQQWFEYCTNGKKKNCPVCKQTCTEKNTHRLYFQSVGDPNDPSLSQKPPDSEEGTPCELRNEVKRLEGKVLKLVSTLEQQQEDLKEVNVEVHGSPFSCFGCLEFAGIQSLEFYTSYAFDCTLLLFMKWEWNLYIVNQIKKKV